MLSKFFPHGTGGGSGPIDYLLGKDRDRENAEILSGDPNLTEQLIDSAPGRHKYTSGVLSFAEQITDEQKQMAMRQYERFLTADGAVSLNFLWVEHTEHDRTELHFVVPNIDLNTGRAYTPYIHKLDARTRDALDNWLNAEIGGADPDDPARRRLSATAADYIKQSQRRQELISAIEQYLTSLASEKVADGGVWTRDDTIAALKELGFEIARATKTGISIAHADLTKNVRLKGVLYEPDCRIDSQYSAEVAADSRSYANSRGERANEAEKLYEDALSKRRKRVAKRYGASAEVDQGHNLDRGSGLGWDAGSDYARGLGRNVSLHQSADRAVGAEAGAGAGAGAERSFGADTERDLSLSAATDAVLAGEGRAKVVSVAVVGAGEDDGAGAEISRVVAEAERASDELERASEHLGGAGDRLREKTRRLHLQAGILEIRSAEVEQQAGSFYQALDHISQLIERAAEQVRVLAEQAVEAAKAAAKSISRSRSSSSGWEMEL